MDTLGSRMVGLMKQYGYTQKELAAEVGVTEATMSRYINNSRTPKGKGKGRLHINKVLKE